MTIKSLTLENLRGFAGKHDVEFTDKQVAAFIGVNGSGKSTVLEAVAVCLIHLVELFTDIEGQSLFRFGIKDINQSSTKAKATIGLDNLTIQGRTYIRHTEYLNGKYQVGVMHSKEITDSLGAAIRSSKDEIPVYAYYHSSDVKQGGRVEHDRDAGDRAKTYEGAFSNSIDLGNSLAHFIGLINLQNNEIVRRRDLDYQDHRVEAYKKGLNAFLAVLERDGRSQMIITEDTEKLSLKYLKQNTTVDFEQLSSGEKLVIGLAMDLIYRCTSANGHLTNPLHSRGVVLIDEIELHLHPRWQSSIIDALTTTFPNIQFIISTHAPLVINQLREEQLFLLTEDRIIPGTELQEPYGMSVGDVISNIMGVPTRPDDVRAAFATIREYLDEPRPENLAAAQRKLDALAELISPNDSEIIQLQTLITLETSEANY